MVAHFGGGQNAVNQQDSAYYLKRCGPLCREMMRCDVLQSRIRKICILSYEDRAWMLNLTDAPRLRVIKFSRSLDVEAACSEAADHDLMCSST